MIQYGVLEVTTTSQVRLQQPEEVPTSLATLTKSGGPSNGDPQASHVGEGHERNLGRPLAWLQHKTLWRLQVEEDPNNAVAIHMVWLFRRTLFCPSKCQAGLQRKTAPLLMEIYNAAPPFTELCIVLAVDQTDPRTCIINTSKGSKMLRHNYQPQAIHSGSIYKIMPPTLDCEAESDLR
jgi:hypothetical protein